MAAWSRWRIRSKIRLALHKCKMAFIRPVTCWGISLSPIPRILREHSLLCLLWSIHSFDYAAQIKWVIHIRVLPSCVEQPANQKLPVISHDKREIHICYPCLPLSPPPFNSSESSFHYVSRMQGRNVTTFIQGSDRQRILRWLSVAPSVYSRYLATQK